MNKEAVYHRAYSDYAYGISKNELLIKIRVKKNEFKELFFIYVDKYKFLRGKTDRIKLPMKKVTFDNLFDYFEIIVSFNMISMCYYFEFENTGIFYGNNSFYESEPAALRYMFTMPVIAEEDVFSTPEWMRKEVIYQIFPDRFKRGDDFKENEKFDKWGAKPTYKSFSGGTLKGIET